MRRSVLAVTAALLFASPVLAEDKTYELRVDGMTCPFCSATSEKALRKIDGVNAVSTDLERGVITVCAADSAALSDAQMHELFLAKGFTYRSMEQHSGC